MVLLIIIPMKNGYFIGNIPYFQTNPNMLKQWEFHGGSMMCTPKKLCKQQRNIIISSSYHISPSMGADHRWDVGPPRPGSLLPKSSGPAESCRNVVVSSLVDLRSWSRCGSIWIDDLRPPETRTIGEISWVFRPSLGFLERIFHLDHLDNPWIIILDNLCHLDHVILIILITHRSHSAGTPGNG